MYRFSNTHAQLGRWRAAAITALVIALFGPFATATPAVAASVSESEPNDSIATANVLTLGDTLSGSSLSKSAQDNDYFAVDLPKAGRLKLTFTFPGGLGTGNAYRLSLYNATGGTLYDFNLKGEHSNGAWLADQGTFAPAGKLYIRIYGYTSWRTWGEPYTLTTTLAAGNVETEFNDTTSTANTLALGTTFSGSSLNASAQDNDYFAVDLPKAGRLKLSLKFPANLGTGDAYRVYIYNATGGNLYHFSLKGEHANGTWLADQGTFAPAGRLYIRIYGYTSWPTWGKTYTLNAALTASNVETELNDTTETADALPLGATFSGSSLNASAQDNDYYAVDLPKAGRLKLSLKFPANLGTGDAYRVYVYNASGASLYYFALKGQHSNGTWLADQGTFAPAGKLYIRIYGYTSGPTWGKTYTLNAALTAGNVETELNDSTATADTLPLGQAISGSSLSASAQDNDYYAVSVPKKQKIRLGLIFPARLGTGNAYSLYVYDSAGRQLSYTAVMASQHNLAKTLTVPAGTIYVRVYGYTGWAAWGKTYQLSALKTLTKAPQPKISGTPKVGSKLTAKPGAWAPAPVKLSYQWLRNGKAIAKATKSTYKLVKADSRKKISVKVTGSKAGYQTVVTTSKTLTIK